MRLAPGLVMPGGAIPWSASGAGARTYADWVTQAAVLAPTLATWGNPASDGTQRVVAATPTGTMTGSTWNAPGGVDRNDRSLSRMLQHAFPTQTPFDENVTSGRVIVYTVVAISFVSSALSLARNGYTSAGSIGDQGSGYNTIRNIKFWNAALGYVVEGDPFTGGPFTQYVW